ncbi:MAG: carboxymuconolactone decarboxylase family protein [Phycisphaerales bacterium]|nr:carboxymuconolactone decarboxylase family protein [Phycisphaerales bacterium]
MAKKKSSTKSKQSSAVPQTYKDFITKYPALGESHERVARTVDKAGPLDEKTRALIKIGICIGAGLDSALRSHVRRAMQAGASEKEIEQATLLAMNTCGLPRTVAAWSWAQQQFARGV